MSEFKIKENDQLNNQTESVINKFSIQGKYKLIGSNSLRSIQYGSDYDVEDIVKGVSPASIAKIIQKAYQKAEKDPNVWIIDFKCGQDDRLVYTGDYSNASLKEYLANPLIKPSVRKAILASDGEERIDKVRDLYILRWKPDDIKRGKVKMIDGTYKSLADCILDKTTMKIDLITKVGNQFAEMSENYYITVNGKSNFSKVPTKKEVEDSLEEDIRYYSHTNSFKALKRIFSVLLIDGKTKNKAKLTKLIDFFNGQVGFLNKIKSELQILETVITSQFRNVKWEDVVANLQFIKEQISNIYKIPLTGDLFKMIDNITPKTALRDIRTLTDYFSVKINNQSKDYLRQYI